MRYTTILVLLLIGCLLALPVIAQETEEAEGIEVVGTIVQGSNIAVSILVIIASLVVLSQAGRLLRGSFMWLTSAAAFFASISIFLLVTEFLHIIEISDTSIIIAWHLLFYTAVGLFIVALRKLGTFDQQDSQNNGQGVTLVFLLLGAWIIVVFFGVKPLDPWLSRFGGTLWDTSGVLHFIAAALAAYATLLLIRLRRTFGKVVTNAVKPFIISMACFSLVHVWELISESWKLIDVGEAVETYESMIFFVAIASLLWAVWGIQRRSKVRM